MISNRF